MITEVAIIIDGEVKSLPKPNRHHHIIREYPLTKGHEHGEQGFIDDKLGFVGRWRAARIAMKEGQIQKPQWGDDLYSEDLW